MAQAFRKWNNIRGSPCQIFQKIGRNIAIFDLVKYGVNGKTVTCLPLGSNFDNFQNYKFCNFFVPKTIYELEKWISGKTHMSSGSLWHNEQFCHIFTPADQLFLQCPASKFTYYIQWALYCIQHRDICVSAGWLHKVQRVLCTAFWTMDMTGVYGCLCEAV